MQRYLRKFLYIISIFLISITYTSKVYADDIGVEYRFELSLEESDSSSGKLVVTLDNKSKNDIIYSYLITIPILDVKIGDIFLGNKKESSIKLSNSGSYKVVDVDFQDPIMPGEKKELSISFTGPGLLKSNFGLRQVYIKNPFENLNQNIKYYISYPKSFGDMYRSYDLQNISEIDDSTNLLEVESTNGIYLLWASDITLNIKSYFQLRNDGSHADLYFNLPPSNSGQSVYYDDLSAFSAAANDEWGNLFGKVTILPNQEFRVGYSADVVLHRSLKSSSIYPESYNLLYNVDTEFAKEISMRTADIHSQYEKIRIFVTTLNDFSQVNLQAFIPKNPSDVWQKIDRKERLNSYEYAAVVTSYAEYLGLKSRIEYGYLLLSPIQMDLSRPQMWNVVQIDGEDVFIDAFLEDLTNISYFDNDYLDRIKFGTWHQSQVYNNVLGLAHSTNQIRIEVSKPESVLDYSVSDVEISLDFPESIGSGSYFEAVLGINNRSQEIIIIEELLLNNQSQISSLKITNNLYQAFMPNQQNKVVIRNLTNSNILAHGESDLNLDIIISGGDDINIQKNIFYYIDIKNIVVFTIIFTLLLSILGIVLMNKKKTKIVNPV